MNQLNNALDVTYRLTFDRLPGVALNATNVILPNVSLAEATQVTPFATIKRHGSKVEFDPLTITFIVDEKFTNYISVLHWMTGLASPVSATEMLTARQVQQPPLVSDAILSVLSNKYGGPVASFTFSGAFPTSLGGVTYNAQDSGLTVVNANAVFSYTSFGVG
jgi:hypothetical protein